MSETVSVAVPRKGRPFETVLERFATLTGETGVADDVASTLRYEKSVAKGDLEPDADVYERLARYSDVHAPSEPEYTLVRDDRPGMPRRVVFDSLTLSYDGVDVRLVGREEPFRALRTHEFALGFDSADLVLEEVVAVESSPLERIGDLNARIDPHDTDVRVVRGLGDTVHHTLLGAPAVRREWPGDALDRSFVDSHEGPLCISPRYERLVQAVLGCDTLDGVRFVYPDEEQTEEAAIAEAGLGVYLTLTGSTARDQGLAVGTELFPSETVLFENEAEVGRGDRLVKEALASTVEETSLTV
jgi:hypothetical protein